MTTPREPTRPTDDALTEPTEGHVDVDAATAAHRGRPSVTESMASTRGASTGGPPMGVLPGAGLTDHDQPVEGGREEAEDDAGLGEGELRAPQGERGAP